MRKLNKVVASFVAILVLASPTAFAASTSQGPFTVSAVVPSNLTLSVALHKNSSTGAGISSMDFGTLQPTATGNLVSSTSGSTGTGDAVAVISANTQAAPYTITQTGTALASGTNTIPSGACQVTPVYATADNGGAANPGTLGSAGSWVATNKTLYTSEASNSTIKVIQAHYAITESASGVVPPNQPAGTYTGQVTFTVTTS